MLFCPWRFSISSLCSIVSGAAIEEAARARRVKADMYMFSRIVALRLVYDGHYSLLINCK